MNDIIKIALTGGPCGGKTTSIQKIVEEFSERNYQVIVVPEAATLLINMGIKPFGEDALKPLEFQKLVIGIQTKLETMAEETIKNSPKKGIILCDRGTIDSKAYIDKQGFSELLKHFNTKEIDLMNEYDLVIHLRTAALGKEEFYTLDNNGARTETIEEARTKDIETLNCWLGHPKLKIIGNDTNFDEKINKVISEIYNILNKPYPIQRQFKYLVDKIDIDKMINHQNIAKLDIEQYIKLIDNKELIYRKTTKNNETSYKLITKQDTNLSNERITTERQITDNDYYNNKPKDEKIIKKTRYCFEYDNQYFRLDIFDEGLRILEIETTNKTLNINIPPYLTVIDDITNNKAYRNSSIYEKINKKNHTKVKR